MTDRTEPFALTLPELTAEIAEITGDSPAAVRRTLAALGRIATAQLVEGNRVRLPELGALVPKATPARAGVLFGKPYATPARRRVSFVAGKALKEAMEGS